MLHLAALLLALLLAPPVLAQGLSPAQRAEVVEIMRDALRRDPTILRDALAAMEEAETRERNAARRAAIERNADALFRNAADPMRGNPRGDVTVVEFFDARCGYCKQLHPALEALVRRDAQVRVVMKDLPILGPNSVLASRALLAAQRQGRYPALHDALMTLRGEPTEAVIRQQAERLGLDWARLRRDMDDPAIQGRIEANIRLAQAIGVEGTPALVIGGALVPGAVELDQLERLVAENRAGR
ncbi:MAG TPA: DsbA family protein [Acetobacteraceae bacterium]|nr:DsbA family protein [Acetobacteraceae bacterium]